MHKTNGTKSTGGQTICIHVKKTNWRQAMRYYKDKKLKSILFLITFRFVLSFSSLIISHYVLFPILRYTSFSKL